MKVRSGRGVVTLYVVIIVVFIMIIMIGRLILAQNRLDTQNDLLEKAKLENIQNIEDGEKEENNQESEEKNYKVIKNNIPIYSGDVFTYFSEHIDDEEEPKYYIYQEDAMYIGGSEKDYILMSDITVDKNENELLYWNKLIKRLDFNNHRIFTKDNQVITRF